MIRHHYHSILTVWNFLQLALLTTSSMYDYRTYQTVCGLHGHMAVVPVGACLATDVETVSEGLSCCNWALRDANRTIHPVRPVLEHPMPMDGRGVRGPVVHVDNEFVALIAFDQGTRKHAVDQGHRLVYAIWVQVVFGYCPVILPGSWIRIEVPLRVEDILFLWAQSSGRGAV